MIEKKTITITIRELFFYLFFAVMFGMRMWGIYEGKPLYGILLVIGFLLWGISMLMNEHMLLEYIVIACLMVVAGLVYINTGEKGLLLYFALMLGMKGIDAKRLFKVGIAVGGLGMATLTFLASFGIIEDVAYVQERAVLGSVFRRSLGFPHPNTLSTSFTILTMMIMYVIGDQDKKKVWKTSIVLFICSGYLYLYSGSRTGIASTVIYLALNLFYAYRKRLILIEKLAVALLMPVLWIVSIVVPSILPDEKLMEFASKDPTLGARWTVGNYYLANNSVSLFGCRLNNPKPEIDGIDLSQLYLFLQLGIVAFVIISILWLGLLYYEVKNKKLNEGLITASLLVMGITDPFLYNLGFKNLAFAFMGVLVFGILAKCGVKTPAILRKKYEVLAIGNKAVSVPCLQRDSSGKITNRQYIVITSTAIAIIAISVIIFCSTPNPKYILADHKPGEHIDSPNIIGQTYSEKDISEFKKEGNLVLNYTDENELMYTYYTDQENAVDWGYYAPSAGTMELFRRSVSIAFWGICLCIQSLIFIIYSKKRNTIT